MKKALLLLAVLLLLPAALAETTLCAVNVGKGDAIFIRTDDCALLIDAGKSYAGGRLRRAMEELGIDRLDGVFLTHIDDDHAEGLDYLTRAEIPVGTWYGSPCFFDCKLKKHPLTKTGGKVVWLDTGAKVSFGGTVLTVLAPLTLNGDDEDENSLVMLLENADGRILLAGDMEWEEEAELLASGADLACDVLKVPNHGDDDACGPELLRETTPRCAVISTDSMEKPGTPDPLLLERLDEMGVTTLVTEGTSAVIARLDRGKLTAETVNWAVGPVPEGVTLEIDREDELFRLTNATGAALSVGGWYLYSEKGNELYVFPDATLPDGGTLTVGTRSATGAYDLLWDEKNVLSDKKEDPVTLYNADGETVCH